MKQWTVVYHQAGPASIHHSTIHARYVNISEQCAVFYNTSFSDPIAVVPYANVRLIRQDMQ